MNTINFNAFTPKYNNTVNFRGGSERQLVKEHADLTIDSADEYCPSGAEPRKYTSLLAKFCDALDFQVAADSIQDKADRRQEAVSRAKHIKQIRKNHSEFDERIADPEWMNDLYNTYISAIFPPVRATRDLVKKMEKEHGKLEYNIRCKTDYLGAGGMNYNLLVFGDGTVHKTPNYITSRNNCWNPEDLYEYIDFANEKKGVSKEEYDKILSALQKVHGKAEVHKSVYNEERGGLVKTIRFGDYHEVEMPSLAFEKPDAEPVVADNVSEKDAQDYLQYKNLYGGVKSINKYGEVCGRDYDQYLKIEYNDGTVKQHYLY